MIGATFFECLMPPCTAYGDRTHTPGLRIRYPEPLDQRGLLACPPVDSNHAPSGSEPDVLSAELDGLMKLVDAGGLEPTHVRRLRLYRPDATPVADAIARKVKESNPQVLPWPGIRHRLRTIPRHPPSLTRKVTESNRRPCGRSRLATGLRHQAADLPCERSGASVVHPRALASCRTVLVAGTGFEPVPYSL